MANCTIRISNFRFCWCNVLW